MSQADNLASLATNVNSSGVLQPAGGGTGTSTSTGTGSVVLSNSPTLVTPTLGSASATQLTTALGSAAAPALTFSGDTNTGIFSPTADTIAFTEGGVESMRIDSAGILGIGVTPSAWTIFKGAQIFNTFIGGSPNNNISYLFGNTFYDGAFKYIATDTAAQYRINDGGAHTWLTAASGTAGTTATFTERMRITSAGDVVIGATSQIGSARFGVQRSGAGECIRWTDGATGGAITTVVSFGTNLNSDAFSFTTNSTERLRIASNGAFGLSGANYGSSGQVLTSNGSGSAPSWATAGGGVTSLNGQTGAITNTGMDNIGSYIAAVSADSIGGGGDGGVVTANTGDTIAGSSLRRNYNTQGPGAFTNSNQVNIPVSYNQGGTALTGTYRCMGRGAGYQRVFDGAQGFWIPGMWVRIS